MYMQTRITKLTNANPNIILLILVSKLKNHLIKLKFVFKNQNQENKILTNVNAESTTFKNGGFFHLARILDGGKES